MCVSNIFLVELRTTENERRTNQSIYIEDLSLTLLLFLFIPYLALQTNRVKAKFSVIIRLMDPQTISGPKRIFCEMNICDKQEHSETWKKLCLLNITGLDTMKSRFVNKKRVV